MSAVLPHGAGGLPRVLGRLHHKYYRLSGSIRPSGRRVLACSFLCRGIRLGCSQFLIAKADLGSVMVCSGYSFPIGYHAPKRVAHATGLGANVSFAVLGGNAVKLSHLEAGCDEHH